MKPITKTLLPILAIFLFAGCLKDKVSRTYSILTPVYKSKQNVLSEVKGQAARQLENPGKIYIYGNYLFINELNKGIHIIDNTNPRNPLNKSFINIPGNVDISVKGNILFADIYTDLLALDISNPLSPQITSLTKSVFPQRSYPNGFSTDSSMYVVDWIKKDTTVPYEDFSDCGSCGIVFNSPDFFTSAASAAKATVGIAGSMSRFSIISDYMYAVSTNALKVFDIHTPASPEVVKDLPIGFGIETIYPFADKLFIGSMSGMFIYDVSSAANPTFVSSFSHARFCDPVITDGDYAYVTLRAGTECGTSPNSELNIIDIKQINIPVKVETYAMKNPFGLGKDGNLLWICDGKDGLKMYDASDPKNIQLKKRISNIEPFDVIPYNGVLIVSAKEGIYQYDYSTAGQLNELSRLQKK